MRLIDADALKETLDYALSQYDDEGKWLEWFKQVIDEEKNCIRRYGRTCVTPIHRLLRRM